MGLTNSLNNVVLPAIVSGSIYALIATGFNLLQRTTRIFNFAQGDMITIAPYVLLVAALVHGLPTAEAVAVTIPIIIGGALVIEYLAIRPFVNKPDSYQWIIATLGVSVILEQWMSQQFSSSILYDPIGLSLAPIHGLSFRTSPQQILVVGMALGMWLLLALLYGRTRLGKMLIAAGEDADGARAVGISASRMSQLAMVLSVLSAAACGLVVAPLSPITPQFGFDLTFIGFVAATIGGMGSISGGFIGGYAAGFIVQVTTTTIGAGWTDTTLFAALLLTYLIRPAGLFGMNLARRV